MSLWMDFLFYLTFLKRPLLKGTKYLNHLYFLAITVNRINTTKHNRQQYDANCICAMKEIKLVLLTDECHWRESEAQSAEPGYCVYIRRTVLTLQLFTHQYLWRIHKEIMHTGTVDVEYVYVCVHVFNVCTDCVTGPQCIHSAKVSRTTFFTLAPIFLFSLSLLFIHYSKLQIVQKRRVLESSLITDPQCHAHTSVVPWNWNCEMCHNSA